MILPERFKKVGRWFYGYEKFFVNYKNNKTELQTIQMIKSKIQTSNYLNKFLIKQHSDGLANLLFYGDIVAMKHSVENRSPFMDHRLVEFSFSKTRVSSCCSIVVDNVADGIPQKAASYLINPPPLIIMSAVSKYFSISGFKLIVLYLLCLNELK